MFERIHTFCSSIFVKIFFWFWCATIVSGIVFYILTAVTQTTPISEHRRNLLSHRRQLTGQTMALYGLTAIEIFERHGLNALNEYSERLERQTGIRTYLFPNGLHTLAGQNPPKQALAMAERALRSHTIEFGTFHDTFLVALPMLNPQRLLYIIVGEVPGAPPKPVAPFYQLPPNLGLKMLITFIVGGIICFSLAWHLASPIRKLRHATQEFAEGNLATRVRPLLGRRGDEIGALAREFDQMAERIEDLVNAQKRLLRDISHELRSPLARLGVALELLRQKTGPEAESSINRIGREAERLNAMIGELLSLNAPDTKETMARSEVDLNALLKGIVEDANFEARSKNCQVTFENDGEAHFYGNAELLERAFENVIRNALRYNAPETAVEIALRHKDDRLEICVRDHGPGVPQDALEKIFLPFYRVADDRDRKSGGTGIGLAITDRAVRLHGGTIRAANHPEGGLEMTITL